MPTMHSPKISGTKNGDTVPFNGYFGGGASLTEALHTAYVGAYLHFSYQKCLVMNDWI